MAMLITDKEFDKLAAEIASIEKRHDTFTKFQADHRTIAASKVRAQIWRDLDEVTAKVHNLFGVKVTKADDGYVVETKHCIRHLTGADHQTALRVAQNLNQQ